MNFVSSFFSNYIEINALLIIDIPKIEKKKQIAKKVADDQVTFLRIINPSANRWLIFLIFPGSVHFYKFGGIYGLANQRANS